ncbi:MAG: GxxExxY protein [Planctomycetes bacterium GWF2_50_10]|nr:MAG: GxxExxY protein [Planctomycetes bacterium GWF2_50_10]
MAEYKHQELTGQIIKAAYTVHNELGAGFIEKIYLRALLIELAALGMSAQSEKPVAISFRGQVVGEHRSDIIVEDKVLIELKALATLEPGNEAQILNYLKATGFEVGLLINFGPTVTVKRFVR